jgi:hypothetical protein
MINLEREIVSTGYDTTKRACIYTVARDDRRWTVSIPLDDLNQHGVNSAARRKHLGNILDQAMNGPADGEKK